MDIIGFNRDLFTYWVNKTSDKQQNGNDFIADVISWLRIINEKLKTK